MEGATGLKGVGRWYKNFDEPVVAEKQKSGGVSMPEAVALRAPGKGAERTSPVAGKKTTVTAFTPRSLGVALIELMKTLIMRTNGPGCRPLAYRWIE